jgi:hypothetical protein
MIDPLTASTTFATVVGLICNYKQEKDSPHRDFMEWLVYHRHEDIKNAISCSQALQDDVNRLLREDHAQILEKLNLINDVLTQVLSKVSGFEVLAAELGNSAKPSPQALTILVLFYHSNARQFVHIENPDQLLLLPGNRTILVKDSRFLQDDLKKLREFHFIDASDYALDGRPIYSLTRLGAEFAKNTNFEPPAPTSSAEPI